MPHQTIRLYGSDDTTPLAEIRVGKNYEVPPHCSLEVEARMSDNVRVQA